MERIMRWGGSEIRLILDPTKEPSKRGFRFGDEGYLGEEVYNDPYLFSKRYHELKEEGCWEYSQDPSRWEEVRRNRRKLEEALRLYLRELEKEGRVSEAEETLLLLKDTLYKRRPLRLHSIIW